MSRILYLIVSLLIITTVILTSCTKSTTTKTTTVITGTTQPTTGSTVTTITPTKTTSTTPTATTVGPVMVKDVHGNLVEKPQYGGTITTWETQNPIAWDPYLHENGGPRRMYMPAVYGTFTVGDWSADRNKCSFLGSIYIAPQYTVGLMAESWEMKDLQTYTINLRKGMKFENKPPVNGREVTAEDVRYCAYRQLGLGEFTDQGRSSYYPAGTWEALIGGSIETVGKYTVIFHLAKPSALFPEYWGTELGVWIYAREMVDKFGKGFGWQNVNSIGPWRLTDFVTDSSLVFQKNPDYYYWDNNFPDNKIPYADTLRVLILPDESTRLSALRTGKIDEYGLSWNLAEEMKKTNPELKWAQTVSVSMCAYMVNSKPPYTDIRVRKAMQMAIDLQGLTKSYFKGNADPFPEYYNKSLGDVYTPLDQFPQDVQEAFIWTPDNPAKAKKLLADAGYPSGFKQTFILTSTSAAQTKELTDLFITYWNAIGIQTDIKVIEAAASTSFLSNRTHDIAWTYAAGYWMPTQVLEYRYGGTWYNFGNANDPVFNKYRDDAMVEPDPVKRTAILKEAGIYGTSQFFYAAGPVMTGYQFWQPWLKGYQGETWLGTWHTATVILARTWVDQKLKQNK